MHAECDIIARFVRPIVDLRRNHRQTGGGFAVLVIMAGQRCSLLEQPRRAYKSELTPTPCQIIPIRDAITRLQVKQNHAHQIVRPSHAACDHRTRCKSVPVLPAPCGSIRTRDPQLCASGQTTSARRASGVCGSCGMASRCSVQTPIRFVCYSCAQCARRGRTNMGRGKTN